MMYGFEDILGRLPNCETFPTGTPLPQGVMFVPSGNERFIPPRLSIKEEGTSLEESKVLIISAPGAVGKSTLAREIGFRKGALLWDLSLAEEVGAWSLDGILSKTFTTKKEDFSEYLSEGFEFIVVDALDEGRVKVNENAFRSMLRDVGNVAKSAHSTCFVLLGRTQTAEDCWLVLADHGVNTSLLSIESFNRSEADAYIDNAIADMKLSKLILECRDLIFKHLAFSVTEDGSRETASKFLHYPPVLDVVATLLKEETNPKVLKNFLDAPSSIIQGRSIELLQKVIDRILDRETNKIKPRVKEAMNASITQRQLESVYSRNEQCKRLLASVFNKQISASPEELPLSIRAAYEKMVETWLGEHPFLQGRDNLANSVFKAYLYARGIQGDLGNDLMESTSADLLNPERLPVRLLAEFCLGHSAHESNIQEVHPKHLGMLYDSLLSSESIHDHLHLTINGHEVTAVEDDESVQIDGEFEFLSNTDALIPYHSLRFTMKVNRDSTLFLGRRLRNSDIVVPCHMVLGGSAKEFQIGPAVYINAAHIKIASESLIVYGNPPQNSGTLESIGTVIEALTCESDLTSKPIVYAPTEFAVSWENDLRFPWTDYRMQDSESNFDSDDLRKTYMRFRRIAQTLRSHGNGALAKTRIKIEDDRVMRGDLGRTLLRQLRDDEILTLRDGFYFWNPGNADKHLGVSWGNLSRGECPPLMQEYLTNFMAKNPDLFG